MPVKAMGATSRIRLQFIDSVDQEGKEKLTSRSYSNVNPDAVDTQVYNVSTELALLQEKPVKAIMRIDEKELIEE
ncbi:DUF1659 domain-containing protein [Natronincola ferrireducens]|uniref:DUF1659 domain-containing protein n=1 Tax=Natronincola ferrireducens TaxID=393762 RepID=A0A1G8XKB6_9FIRM|nr:DUF1659 domain-containing protein [Natronincola ferrireducens]SDJ90674.1 Protein of unknown function [Natronincola ferrireducens]